jgi:hypothetical protein
VKAREVYEEREQKKDREKEGSERGRRAGREQGERGFRTRSARRSRRDREVKGGEREASPGQMCLGAVERRPAAPVHDVPTVEAGRSSLEVSPWPHGGRETTTDEDVEHLAVALLPVASSV